MGRSRMVAGTATGLLGTLLTHLSYVPGATSTGLPPLHVQSTLDVLEISAFIYTHDGRQ